MLELLGGLSLVTDLGSGSPLEESLKRCLVAARLARISGCPEPEVSDVLYTALLQHLGCTAYAHEVRPGLGRRRRDDARELPQRLRRARRHVADLGPRDGTGDRPIQGAGCSRLPS